MKLGIYFLFAFFALAAGTAELQDGFAPNPKAATPIQVTVLSEDQANSLFKEFASDKSIPYKYPADGCYARTTQMTYLAEKKGIQLARVYAEGSLQVKTGVPNLPYAIYGWHVSPVTYVKDAKGQSQLMVFEPSLFDKPVTLDQWKKRLVEKGPIRDHPKIDTVYFGSEYKNYPRHWPDADRKSWSEEDLANVQKIFSKFLVYQKILNDPNASPSDLQTAEPSYYRPYLNPGSSGDASGLGSGNQDLPQLQQQRNSQQNQGTN